MVEQSIGTTELKMSLRRGQILTSRQLEVSSIFEIQMEKLVRYSNCRL